ncbi:MAG: hypothetical protein QMB94_02800, partial [Phycisphaerales bacterium]
MTSIEERLKNGHSSSGIVGSFGVPLNAEEELSFGRFDGFDDAVRCFANDRQPPGMIKCLDVMTMDASSESSPRDVMNRSIAMLVRRLKTIRKMLVQSTACVEP